MTQLASGRVDRVLADLRSRGHTLTRTDWGAITSDTGGPTEVDAPVAVTPLVDDAPLTVVSAIANAAHRGFVPLLVTDSHEAVEPLLSEPFLLRGAGPREFYDVEDRIGLPDDSYACVGTPGTLRWAETDTTDSPGLTLRASGDVVAAFDGVGALTCPGPSTSAFRYSYARGEDGRFRVFRDGAVVGRYTGVGAMRADGFRPTPLPLVPEHHVRENGRLARQTVVAVVGDRVTYHPV